MFIRGRVALAGVILAILSLFATIASLKAHNLPYSLAAVDFPRAGEARIVVRCHLVPLFLGEPQGSPDSAQISRFRALSETEFSRRRAELEEGLEALLSVRANGALIESVEWKFPTRETIVADALAPQYEQTPSPPITITARYSPNASTFDIALPPQFGEAVLTISTPAGATITQPLAASSVSEIISLNNSHLGEDVMKIFRFIVLGFKHIIPFGYDHVLFVIALAIATPRFWPVFKLATTFTIAHSITLGLAALRVINLPVELIEPAIALSITAVALIALVSPNRDLGRPRLLMIFGFGLLHGLGFAGALREVGIPIGDEVTALLGFNIGIELGQIAIVAAVITLVLRWRDQPDYFKRVVLPVNALIGLLGIAWTVERLVK